MTEAEAKTIQGNRVEISERGDWVTFHIDVGTQYPVRLSTKVKAVIDHAREFGTGPGLWHFNESQGNENPNKPGTFYTNRYLNKVESVSGDGQTAIATPSVSSSSDERMTKQDWDNKDRRDYRSRSWAQTISALSKEEGETDDAYFLRLQGFQRKVYQDITGDFAYPEDGSDVPFS